MQADLSSAAIAPRAGGKWRQQLPALGVMLAIYMLSAAIYMVIPGGALDPRSAEAIGMAPQVITMPVWQLVLGNMGVILVIYGLLGLAGYWLSTRAQLPGVFRSGAGWRDLALWPLGIGAAAGIALVAADLGVQRLTGLAGFPHPIFPASILASLSAGIGEEILTRFVVLGLWAAILTWLLRRAFPNRSTRRTALWIANGIGALAFAASHLPAAMIIAGVTSPAALPPAMLAEGLVLNGLIGILAGEAYIKNGLVAASGIHFWCDIVWHVVYGILK